MALEDLYTAIAEHRLVQFTYENQKGEISTRTCESYSVENGKFWGWDIAKDGIRQFFLAMMENVEMLETTFVPRF